MNRPGPAANEERADARQLLQALIVTVVSTVMLLGSLLLARLETPSVPSTPTQAVAERPTATPYLPTLTPQPGTRVTMTPRPTSGAGTETPEPEEGDRTATATAAGTELPTTTSGPSQSPAPTTAPTYQPQPTLTLRKSPAPKPVCQHPAGWTVYMVQSGDTLAELARRFGTTTGALMRGNCLGTSALFAGQHLYVPRFEYATATPEPTSCGPPLNWVVYIVQPGDTLYSLSRRYDVSVEVLRRANCLSGHDIDLGQALYVPPTPATPWPSPTFTPWSTPSATRTRSATPVTLEPTPTSRATLRPVPTPTSPVAVPSPTSSATAVPTTIRPTPTSTGTTLPAATIAPTGSPASP